MFGEAQEERRERRESTSPSPSGSSSEHSDLTDDDQAAADGPGGDAQPAPVKKSVTISHCYVTHQYHTISGLLIAVTVPKKML